MTDLPQDALRELAGKMRSHADNFAVTPDSLRNWSRKLDALAERMKAGGEEGSAEWRLFWDAAKLGEENVALKSELAALRQRCEMLEQDVETHRAAGIELAGDLDAAIACAEQAERERDALKQSAWEVYEAIPSLPIIAKDMDAATDALSMFCGAFNDAIIEHNDAAIAANTNGGQDNG